MKADKVRPGDLFLFKNEALCLYEKKGIYGYASFYTSGTAIIIYLGYDNNLGGVRWLCGKTILWSDERWLNIFERIKLGNV